MSQQNRPENTASQTYINNLENASRREQLHVYRDVAYKSSVICLGWMKLINTPFYVLLFVLVESNGSDVHSIVAVMLLVAVVPIFVHATLLIYAGIEKNPFVIDMCIVLSLLLGLYISIIGVMGFVLFVRTGTTAAHCLLAVVFFVMIFNLFCVLCYDVILLFTFKQTVLGSSITLRDTRNSVLDHLPVVRKNRRASRARENAQPENGSPDAVTSTPHP